MIYICSYCGSCSNRRKSFETDHVYPRSKGGVTTTIACKKCNRSKGAKTLLQWFRWLKINGYYLWEKILDCQHGQRGKFAKIAHKVRDESLGKSIQLYRFY